MNENFTEIDKDGTTLSRKAFFDQIYALVLGSEKLPGKNIRVDEYWGYGSVLSVFAGSGSGSGGGGACCVGSGLTYGDCVDVPFAELCTEPSIFHDGVTCAEIRCEGACARCKFCLGPINICDCGEGAYDCHYDCIDNLTFDECEAYTGEGYSTAWFLAADCDSFTACDVFEGGCFVGTTGACCLGGFCVDSFTEFDCSQIEGATWYVDCLCSDCPPDCCM